MAELAAVEETLSLFTEGMAGRYFHIKATDEFSNARRLIFDRDQASQSRDALYLPEHLDAPDISGYRVLVMQQLGQRECGTFTFRLAAALERIPELRHRYETPRGAGVRSGDFQLLFGSFPNSSLASELFALLEQARVQGHLMRTYPGLQRHMRRYFDHLLQQPAVSGDPLVGGYRHLWGETEQDPMGPPLGNVLDELAMDGTDVMHTVTWLCRLYDEVASYYVTPLTSPYTSDEETLTDWMNREQRVEEWEDELRQLDANVLAVELLEAEDLEAERGDTGEGAVREAEVDLKSLKDERDTLKRRIDMEKSSVQHALGPDRAATRSYRYDEWDYLQRRYLTHWCRVYEEPLTADEEDTQTLAEAIRRFRPQVQKQLEQIRPTGLQRVSRVPEGDELDLNAVIEARQDIRAGLSPDERVYTRKERMHRDVCAIFLVDLSASTDDPIEPPAPFDWTGYEDSATDNLRDAWLDAEVPEPEPPKRKIIDIQREAMVVMTSALEALGDSYGIYGFSGYGKDCVELYVAKEPQDGFSARTLNAIAAMKPKRSTRMGPAIRHSTHKLMQSGHAMKVLIVISDGFPQDSDYGPQRGQHDYGVEDTAKALQEAQQKGVETFCVTVDRSGQDYLRRMCPDSRYLVIEEMEDLPDQLSKVYATLTGR